MSPELHDYVGRTPSSAPDPWSGSVVNQRPTRASAADQGSALPCARRIPERMVPWDFHMNPLLEINFRVPFDKIQAADVEPAIDELLTRAQAKLTETTHSRDPLMALDTMTENLDFAMAVVRHLESVAT